MKKIIFFLLLASGLITTDSFSQAVKISDLPGISGSPAALWLPAAEAGATKKVSGAQLVADRLAITDTTGKWIANVYNRNDSLFYKKNTTETFITKIVSVNPTLQATTDAGNTTTNDVKIGDTDAPGANLHVKTSGSNQAIFESSDDEASIKVKGSTIADIKFHETGSGYIGNVGMDQGALRINSGNGNWPVIINDNGGNVGIGVAPDSSLTVNAGIWAKRGVRFSALQTGAGTKALRIDTDGNITKADTTVLLANTITGSLTTNTIPKATGANTLGNSIISDNGTVVTVTGTAASGVSTPFTVIGGTGTSAGGLKLGAYSATYGGFWSNNVTPTTSNYALISTGASTVVNSTSNLDFTISDGAAWRINSLKHFIAPTDNTYDIGASGATRPRTGYFGTNVNAPTVEAGSASVSGAFQAYNSGSIKFYAGAGQVAVTSAGYYGIGSSTTNVFSTDTYLNRQSAGVFGVGTNSSNALGGLQALKLNLGSLTSNGSTSFLTIGHNGTTAGSSDGTATLRFASQFSNYPFTMGAEGNGYNFWIRQTNGGQGTFGWDFGTISSTLYQRNMTYITDHYEDIYTGKWLSSFSGSGSVGAYFGFKNSILANSTSTKYDAFRIERPINLGYYQVSDDPILSLFSGSSNATITAHNRYVARFNRLGYLGIGTLNDYAVPASSQQAALTINQGSKSGTTTNTGTTLMQVVTVGSSTTVSCLGHVNGENAMGLIVGSKITANGITRTITSIPNSAQFTVDAAVNWSNGGAGYNFTFKNPYIALIDSATKYFIVDGDGNVGIGTNNPTKLLQVGTINPVISLKQATSAQQYDINIGLGTGLSSQKFEIKDVTSGIPLFTASSGASSGPNVAIGTTTPYASSSLYVTGGSAGANIDAQANGTSSRESNIEAMAINYASGKGIAMRLWSDSLVSGATVLGNAKQHLALLDFNEDLNIIRTNNTNPLIFGVNDAEKARLDVAGTLSAVTLKTTPVAYASLPTGAAGMVATINDSNTDVWGATAAGGGALTVMIFFNGTVWTVIGK